MKTVLFDFDGTLTKRDTLRPLGHHLAEEYRRPGALILLYCILVLLRLRMIDDKKMKEIFLGLFAKGKDRADIHAAVKKFFERRLEGLLNRRVFDALTHHRQNGDAVYIVSANFDFVLEPLVPLWGLGGLICTETEKKDGIFTGKIVGKTCKGNVKAEKIRARFSQKDIEHMVAFGDAEDSEMLGMVREAILVRGEE